MNPTARRTNLSVIAAYALIAVAILFLASSAERPVQAGDSAQLVDRTVFDDTVQPMSEEIVARAITRAGQDHAALLMIDINTPGGLLDSTRKIVAAINQSTVPVAIFVSPTGSRAASAGFFLLQAADVAAMAPGTNTGAAHPVVVGTTLDPIMKQKLEQDTTAFLRSYSARRGRNTAAAETAVLESKAFSDKEALDLHLIDLIAKDDADLLRQLDGRVIKRFDGTQQTLHLARHRIVTLQPTLRENILDRLMRPDLALFILVLGGLLIYLEFHVPGTVVPGAAGTLLVLLALFALDLLPVHYTAAGVLAGGLLLLFSEAKFPSHGLLALLGSAALVFGMLTLVDGPVPQLRVGPAMALAGGLSFGGITFLLAATAMRAKRNKVRTGTAALVGETALVLTPLAPAGQVLVHGEIWTAHCAAHAAKGSLVVVRSFSGLTLEVAPND